METHRSDQIRLPLGVKPLDAKQNYGRKSVACERDVSVKVVIQSHAGPAFLPAPAQNIDIFCQFQPDLADVYRVHPAPAKA